MSPASRDEAFETFARDFIRSHQASRPHWRVDRILAPTDFSVCSLTALEHAEDLARVFRAELVIMHVEEAPLTPAELVAITGGAADREIGRVVEHLHASRIRCRGVVRAGVPAAEILTVAAEEDVGLVVMGTHGRRGMRHLLLGSVAEHVVRAARCPVLTTRPQERA